ncbi:unnamed protein product [Cyclocybe aegerita]|uniref:Uncharacterized protein n=1 Tax=Cyclocybe aegerita TaxID=1973307 RepID=A0A8S0XJ25_CYCAE|nr:unnamed protein product [Cyclocybe aegerita]
MLELELEMSTTSTFLEVPPPHNPCAIMEQFPLPRVYKSKNSRGRPTRLIVFGFPISKNYLLQFADAHNILLNDQDLRQRRLAAYIHMGLVVGKHFDAQLIDVLDDDDGTGDNASFSVAVASNRSSKHLSRMRTYRYLEQLADFLRLNPDGAEWAYANIDDVRQVTRAGNRAI